MHLNFKAMNLIDRTDGSTQRIQEFILLLKCMPKPKV